MAERFTFRPAPLRSARDWRLDGDVLEGPDRRCDLSRVRQARFVETVVRRARLRRLDLDGPEGRCRIAINCPQGLPPDDPERAAHRALCIAVARRLAARAPDMPVTIGEGGVVRAIWFVVGLVSLLTGLGLIAGAIYSGLDGERLMGAAVPTVLLIVLGGALVGGSNPWRTPPHVPAEALPALIEALDAPPEPPAPPLGK